MYARVVAEWNNDIDVQAKWFFVWESNNSFVLKTIYRFPVYVEVNHHTNLHHTHTHHETQTDRTTVAILHIFCINKST